MRDALRGGRAAFSFLTIIPVGGFPYSARAWRWSAAWFPFVGAFLGLVAAGVFMVLRPAGLLVAAMSAVGITVFLTGAFHEDGLADSVDALGGAYDRERLFAILKDSRVGTYGALALIFSVGLRAASLVSLDSDAPLALILAHTLARTSPVWLMATLPYVTSQDTSKSRPVVRGSYMQSIVGTTMSVGLLVFLSYDRSVSLEAIAWIVGMLVLVGVLAARTFVRRAGGITGDFLGAAEQCNEVVILVTLAYLGLT